MAVPKRHHSHSRTRKRRSHDALKPLQLQKCRRCSKPVLPHVICPTCGHYMGRTLVEAEA